MKADRPTPATTTTRSGVKQHSAAKSAPPSPHFSRRSGFSVFAVKEPSFSVIGSGPRRVSLQPTECADDKEGERRYNQHGNPANSRKPGSNPAEQTAARTAVPPPQHTTTTGAATRRPVARPSSCHALQTPCLGRCVGQHLRRDSHWPSRPR